MKPDYDITRKQHFIMDGKDEEFLAFLEGEGFTYIVPKAMILDDPFSGYLAVDMEKKGIGCLGRVSHAPAGQGLVILKKDFLAFYPEIKPLWSKEKN